MPLVEFRKEGFYVPHADVYIDPILPVKRALITHGHADHVRYGNQFYLATHEALPVIKYRLGSHIKAQGLNFGEILLINGVSFSFYPAGHIIGSAQIRIEYKGEIWVLSGDYKLEKDGLSKAYEPVECHTFITESTFGLPQFKWNPQETIFSEINAWWKKNTEDGKVSLLASYALGKAQRIINNVDRSIGKVYVHGAIENINEVLRKQGYDIGQTIRVEQGQKPSIFNGSLVIAPPPSLGTLWSMRFGDFRGGIVSGWIQGDDDKEGFALSDHADYSGLMEAVRLTGAEKVFVNHGSTKEFSESLRKEGYDAEEVKVKRLS